MGVGIWLVPYLVRHLGTAAYGLIPIAGMLTQYVGLISQSISSAVSRFLTIALQRDDADEANRIFSTAFFSYLCIGLLQIPLFGLIIYLADRIISIPEELFRDAITLLVCSAAAFVVNLVSSVFGVPAYAFNRLDISRSIDIARQLIRLLGVVSLFTLLGPTLRYVGYVDLAIAVILCPVQLVIAGRLAPRLRLRLRHYDWGKIRSLTTMGGWLLVNNVGTLLFLRMDVWVCNRFIGPETAGEYAAVLQWPTLIRHGGAIIAAVTAPMIVIYYAKSEMEQLIRLSRISVRLLSLLLTVPIAVMCVFSAPLLRLWLGESYTHLAPLMVVMLCHLASNVGIVPLFNIHVAMNKVRVPAVVTLVMGGFNLALAVTAAAYLGWGAMGVAVAGAAVLSAKNAIWTPLYTARILKVRWHTFFKPYAGAAGLMVGFLALGYLLTRMTTPESWVALAATAVGMTVVGFAVVVFILPSGDRQAAMKLALAPLRPKGTGCAHGDMA